MTSVNRCETCGACCALFPVKFSRLDAPELCGDGSLSTLFSQIGDDSFIMNGTNNRTHRCAALAGKIGVRVSCLIYERRPNCCRTFEPAWEIGDSNSLCNRARATYGLPTFEPF